MKFARVRHASSVLAKGRIAQFSSNVGRLSLSRKNISPFSHIELFGYDKAPNEGIVKFSAKFSAISLSPRK